MRPFALMNLATMTNVGVNAACNGGSSKGGGIEPVTPAYSPEGRGGCRLTRKPSKELAAQPRRSACALLTLLLIFGSLGAGGEGWTIRPRRGRGQDVLAFLTRAGCPIKKPGQPSRTLSSAAAEGAKQGALSSWLLLLWARKEEVTRAAAAARNTRRRRDNQPSKNETARQDRCSPARRGVRVRPERNGDVRKKKQLPRWPIAIAVLLAAPNWTAMKPPRPQAIGVATLSLEGARIGV